ncbi:hypothetical protein CYMTET_7093 [Cymbomonas tetramitiformis]|uniref:Uncharacterized protein n=1 Tax=Cymbomonas tetramitiformis TaxID=36881 RepID=A0AAE0LHU4_9CHLO|nr:hypothetical protein CYMTET_7093 [Cymbomonas tetramitiformis]
MSESLTSDLSANAQLGSWPSRRTGLPPPRLVKASSTTRFSSSPPPQEVERPASSAGRCSSPFESPGRQGSAPHLPRTKARLPSAHHKTKTYGQRLLKSNTDVRGTYLQFFFDPVTFKNSNHARDTQQFWKHFDVLCEWDKGQEDMDTHQLAEGMRHRRLTYSWSLFKISNDLSNLHEIWENFRAECKVDVEEVASWVNSLKPRSIHDFKPLLILLQFVLRTLLRKELNFYSAQIQDLSKQLGLPSASSMNRRGGKASTGGRKAESFLREELKHAHAEGARATYGPPGGAVWGEWLTLRWLEGRASGVVEGRGFAGPAGEGGLLPGVSVKGGGWGAGDGDKDLRAQLEAVTHLYNDAAATNKLLNINRKWGGAISHKRFQTIEIINEKLGLAEADLQSSEAARVIEAQRLSSLIEQKTETIEDLMRQLEEARDANARLNAQAKVDAAALQKALLGKEELSKLVEKLTDKNHSITGSLNAAAASANTTLCQWAVNRYNVSTFWGTRMMVGVCPLSVPAESVIKLPAKAIHNGYAVDLTDNASCLLPPGESIMVWPPSKCTVIFKPGSAILQSCAVPAATRFKLPKGAKGQKHSILVPPNTRVLPPSAGDEEAEEAQAPDAFFSPPGGPSRLSVLGGSTCMCARHAAALRSLR